ncbi:copper chaperone PCu(A)C [Magnetospirillum molischianum]|uniref:Copper chaperone PCu(A)C n=1 Tax=Magnetospirillum molischianum DSM 120 TaxID=1150626 RepID=H8FV23_MAGML|nr:copper chaperone PCu(A)C [Magnetospirillum molischianum]CCG42211.1 conserved exported hypothetical protein [Magnetospirillum molischianum DSM 120]
MKRFAVAVGALALGLAALPALAADIEISGSFLRPPVVDGGNGAAFFTITNHGPADRLIAAAAPAARAVELHTHLRDGDVMRMRKVDSIAVPEQGRVELKPGGDHVMLFGLDPAAVVPGARLPLTLTFEQAGAIQIEVPVATLPGPISKPGAHGDQ